ncbi:MAG: response regulator receiver [Nitrospirae bacterium]|nr:MAG: response regulator receiver [Nitrospirota bacterium]
MPKVLIVEDEPLIRLLLEQTLEGLESCGVEVCAADNGIDAVEKIKAERPELVLLDVMMPKMNGFEVCSIVKQQLQLKEVYIIMLTAKGQEQDRLKAIEAGTDEFITKPFSIVEVADRVKAVLKIRM